ncbi:MAG: dioxygenase [SAR202 cluster bacterium]|nr:dioxygenase [SAR202 cluster bacterium]
MAGPMPALFVAHGAPFVTRDGAPVSLQARGGPNWIAGLFKDLNELALSIPKPRAVLILSAHWEERPVTIGATTTVPLTYDFYGFPEQFYHFEYPAPGAPELAERVRELLGPTQQVAENPERGLDHGAYAPLAAMYPDADVPVLQVSLPTMDPETLFKLGQTLAPLRNEGVLIVGSGFITHNLRTVDLRADAPVPSWAADFDSWSAEVMAAHDIDRLVTYKEIAPGVRFALPTHEHFVPSIVAAGAGTEGPSDVKFPLTGFIMGSFTRRSVRYG